MANFIKKAIFNTDLNADSVEWCPIDGFRHVFTCGTYQLSKAESLKDMKKQTKEQRIGDLYLFELAQGPELLKLVEKIHLVGILDCKWAHRKISNHIFLAVATSLGDIRIFQLQEEGSVLLKHVCTHKLNSSSTTLALSLDWSTGLSDTDVKILVSDSEGFITLVSFADGQICEDCKWKLHDFQAWIVAFNYWDTNVFYSGGDDCQLYVYDRRSDKVNNNGKAHSAGITSMHCNVKTENVLVSGSYDEHVLVWDARCMTRARDSVKTGGGVWRLKWEPQDGQDIAAAIMHGGFAVLDGTAPRVIAEYKEHSSIGYGMDWCHLDHSQLTKYLDLPPPTDKKSHLLAACSFYDNLLSLAVLHKEK